MVCDREERRAADLPGPTTSFHRRLHARVLKVALARNGTARIANVLLVGTESISAGLYLCTDLVNFVSKGVGGAVLAGWSRAAGEKKVMREEAEEEAQLRRWCPKDWREDLQITLVDNGRVQIDAHRRIVS
jgi:hypothetical protein